MWFCLFVCFKFITLFKLIAIFKFSKLTYQFKGVMTIIREERWHSTISHLHKTEYHTNSKRRKRKKMCSPPKGRFCFVSTSKDSKKTTQKTSKCLMNETKYYYVSTILKVIQGCSETNSKRV